MFLFIKDLLHTSTGNNGEIPQWNWEYRVLLKILYRQREDQKITLQTGQNNRMTGGSCPFRVQEQAVTRKV